MKTVTRILLTVAVVALAGATAVPAFAGSAPKPKAWSKLNVVPVVPGKKAKGTGKGDIFVAVPGKGGVKSAVRGDPAGVSGSGDVFVATKDLEEIFTGGGGADLFVFKGETSDDYSMDTIVDFNPAEGDRIDLTLIDATTKTPGRQAFKYIGEKEEFEGPTGYAAAGQLRFWNGYLIGDTNGTWSDDGSDPADFELIVNLKGVDHLDADALVLEGGQAAAEQMAKAAKQAAKKARKKANRK